MCIIPLSIVIAFSSLEVNAVTKAGQFIVELTSGKIAFVTSYLILFIKSLLSFSIKKTGILFMVFY